jgi:phenylalanyl-tRNA synthetase alpha chain
VGHLHPLTQSLRRAQDIFAALGFQFVEGPEIEQIAYNFDNLNIGPEHPSRAETDTFYLKDFPDLVLRTHVSTLQSRGVLENNLKPPFRIFYYGPTYRSEKEDATHGSVFHQYEFMVVDEKVNLADLKSIVQTFYSLFFGKEMEIRFRPGFFPFVEPGLEVDIRDKVTKKGGWLEMAGAGAVHPEVLKKINIDPAKYQGIALGGGLDRLAMLKYGVPDIRLLYSGNVRFLEQF